MNYAFDVHLSVFHGEKLDTTQTGSQSSVIPKTKELEIKTKGEENNCKNKSKRRNFEKSCFIFFFFSKFDFF